MKKETMIKPEVGVVYECYIPFTDFNGDRCRKGQKFIWDENYPLSDYYCMDKASGRGICIRVLKDKFASHFIPSVVEEPKPKVKVGDVVKIIKNECLHDFEIGEEVTITEVNENDYRAKSSDGEQWYLSNEEFELVTKAEPKSYIDTDKKLNQIDMINMIRSMATPEQIKAVAEIIPGLKEQLMAQYPELFITHKAGNHYFNENDVEFVMATQAGHVALVNLETGTIVKTVYVKDINNITDAEFNDVCAGGEYSLV